MIRGINGPTNGREAGGDGAPEEFFCGATGSSEHKSIRGIDFRENGMFGSENGSVDGALF